MQHWNSINYNMKCLIDSSIKDAILHSGLSDIELGQKLNVSITTIFKWRTRNSYKIRSSNAVALADLLDKEISFDKGVVSFINKQINFTAKNVDTFSLYIINHLIINHHNYLSKSTLRTIKGQKKS